MINKIQPNKCHICNKGTPTLFICKNCGYTLCINCLPYLFNKTALYNLNICYDCYKNFEINILTYLYLHPEDRALFINIKLKYSPWDEILKDFIKGQINQYDLLNKTNIKLV